MQIKNNIKLLLSELIWKHNYPLIGNSITTKELKKNGVTVLENFIDPSICDDLVKKADIFINNNPYKVKKESNNSDFRVYGVNKYTNDFFNTNVEEITLKEVKKFYFTTNPKKFTLLGRIISSKDNLGSGGGWHRDSPFMHQFKTILYLTDVEIDNGPFQYVIGSHTSKALKQISKNLNKPLSEYRFKEQEIDKLLKDNKISELKTFTAKKGTLILADTRGLHRGKPIITGKRYALTEYTYPKKIPKKFN